jgi:hypothetical protein
MAIILVSVLIPSALIIILASQLTLASLISFTASMG